jgi:hypothetical protein
VRDFLILAIELEGGRNYKVLILKSLVLRLGPTDANREIHPAKTAGWRRVGVPGAEPQECLCYQVISSPGIRTRLKMDWLVGSNFIGIRRP